jgi:hypothetical protein
MPPMMRARRKMVTHDVWQYVELFGAKPLWVLGCTEAHYGDLYLVRSSGRQRLELGDYLIRDLDGEPMWSTDADFRREYEMLSTA